MSLYRNKILTLAMVVFIVLSMFSLIAPKIRADSTDSTLSAPVSELSWISGTPFPVVNGRVIFPPADITPTNYENHWWAGSVSSWYLTGQDARTIYVSIRVPYVAPKSDEFYYVLLSAWTDTGSYVQIGFSGDYGIWGLTYSWTSGPIWDMTYHYDPNAMSLSLGVTYTFYITTQSGVTHFTAYQDSTDVWSLDAPTGGDYLYLHYLNNGFSGYTNYEEMWYASTDGGSPAFDFYFFDNYWVSLEGQINAATDWWTFFSNAPGNLAVVIDDNSVLVDNPSATVLFQTNPATGTIAFSDSTYGNGQNAEFSDGDYFATANAPAGYQFHHWEYSGSSESGVYVPDVDVNPATVHVLGDGWLKAIYTRLELELERETSWYWTQNTEVGSVVVGDVDGDTAVEIVSGGAYFDGTRDNAQLCVWDGSTLTLEKVTTWYWTSDTLISSVVVSDVDADGSLEIVTGGYHDDGVRWNAQLCVWDGSTLALENVKTWYWTDWTVISSVAVGDVDADGSTEIVTGGNYNDGTRNIAQLCVWDGAALTLEDVATWYWTADTGIYSVGVSDVDGDGSIEIVTGGYYWDGTRTNAQLCVWDGATLALENVTAWYWTSHTIIYSLAVGDVDADDSIEIVTSGQYDDGMYYNAQLCVWDGSTLTLENVKTWYWTSLTSIASVFVGDVDADGSAEIVTGGKYSDFMRWNAQLCVWDGSTLALEDVTTWYWANETLICSVAVGDVDGDGSAEIVTGGYYNDGMRLNAQLTVWVEAQE